MTTYTYSIQNDFPNHAVNLDSFALQIAVVTDLSQIYNGGSTNGDVCSFLFSSDLTTTQQTELATLISSHQGQPPIATSSTVNITLPDGTIYTNVVINTLTP